MDRAYIARTCKAVFWLRLKKIVLLSFVFLLLSTAMIGKFIRPVVAEETIYIKSDGSVEGTDKIQRDGEIYIFTGNINDKIVVERSNIVIDGNGYTLQGPGASLQEHSEGISLSGRNNVTLKNMKIRSFLYGISLNMSSNNNTISGNVITDNWFGISLFRASNNIISRNNMENTVWDISLSRGSNNTISGNKITTSSGIGITVSGIMYDNETSNNIISGNNIKNNQLGIQLMLCSNNTISGNYIANNKYGIQLNNSPTLGYTSNNTICHNDFIGNTNHVWVLETGDVPTAAYTNFWDDGYPSGGNYWSDYNGTDIYNGTHQNETGSDGIGDSPYIIDANNKDNYPLMEPVVIPEFPDDEKPATPTTEPFPTWIAAAIVIVALVGVALLVYIRKIRKTTGEIRRTRPEGVM